MEANYTIQNILQKSDWKNNVQSGSKPILNAIEKCRTKELGFHLQKCDADTCNAIKHIYHSCRNRHCPNCGFVKKEEWIEARMRELFPCSYFHIVFTIPHQLNAICMGNRKPFFNLMLEASSYTLLKFSEDKKMLGAVPGIISVLHTWGQQLSFHPHIHCIVSGGGLTKDGNFKIASKAKSGILFPVKAMKVVYRAFFMRRLNQEVRNGNITLTQEQRFNFAELKDELFKKEWIVYAKRPFGGPQQVIEYLGRYVNKVAISNQRIKKMDNDTVTFEYKDYSDASKTKLMSLTHQEFLRRFEQHILPFRFTKIRSYGLYANNNRKKRVTEIFAKQKWPPHPKPIKVPLEIRLLEAFCVDITKCPTCKTGTMKLMQIVLPIKKERNDALDDWPVMQNDFHKEK